MDIKGSIAPLTNGYFSLSDGLHATATFVSYQMTTPTFTTGFVNSEQSGTEVSSKTKTKSDGSTSTKKTLILSLP
jgi:hypothetical protein